MGKQWLLKKMTGNSSTPDTRSAGKSRETTINGLKHNTTSSSATGCMNAIFHLFDIQNNHFPFQQSSINIPLQENNLQGVEAPRNSLEIEHQEHMVEAEPSSSSSSSSRKLKQETNNFNIPMVGIQIKTKRTRLMEQDINNNNISSSECSSSSPAASKTPNLVARLMGLDLLPENSSPRPSLSSPRPSSSSSHATPIINPLSKLSSIKNNTRSLPGTPRISTAARPSTEVDHYHHRFSLQNSKENRMRYDESRCEYAKEIAKQVRENISRRVCADMTNVERKKEKRRDEFLVVLKPMRPSPPSSTAAAIDKSGNIGVGKGLAKENKPIQLSSSPRLKLLEIKNNLNRTISNLPKTSQLSSSTEVISKPSSLSTTKSLPSVNGQLQVVKHEIPLTKLQKCKKNSSEKYDLRLKKMHQQEDHKKSTPLSKHLVKVNTTTKFISFKKDIASDHPSITTTLTKTQVPCITQLPNCQNRSYNTKKTTNLTDIDDVIPNGKPVTTATITGTSFSDQFDYISKILRHSGIEKNTPISITHWYSPSHPIHPSIFQQIEKFCYPKTTTNLATRKLVFDVTNELLIQILKPYISFKPWVLHNLDSNRMFGSELIEKLCKKVGCFPHMDCRFLEDIDGLIENDMNGITRVVGKLAFEEEAEELVAELERDMVDTLVGEVAGIIWHVGC